MHIRNLVLRALLCSIPAALVLYPVAPASAAVADWQRGASMIPRYRTDFSSPAFNESLANLAGTHANYATLIIPLYQTNLFTADIQPGFNTPTDQSLIDGIQKAHSLGLRVMLKIHLDPYSGEWRAFINPDDRDGWFANYGSQILHYAGIAQAHGVESYVIGTELIDMAANDANPANTSHWQSIIASVRRAYSGQVSYSANWGWTGTFADEKNRITFWPSLDFIGLSAYFELHTDNSVPSLMNEWGAWLGRDIGPLQQRWGKPIVFTEVGYRSVSNARLDPWNSGRAGAPDETEQANDYQALMSFWNSQNAFAGVHWWDWSTDPNAGFPGSTDYTPQHKQAQSVMTQFFSSGGAAANPPPAGTPPPSPPTPAADPVFNSSAAVSPAAPTTGQPASIAATVTDSSANTLQGGIVDVEVYNQAGIRVLQQFFENQIFAARETKTFAVPWTPGADGSYSVKIGVFAAGWTRMLHWNDGAAGASVAGAAAQGPVVIDIWWPADGGTVGGLQPFKAIVPGLALGDYQMFWQVDGDRSNLMSDSFQDFPHKEAWVDVAGWTWRANGPYRLTFSAQRNGTLIGERSIQIMISH